jgi:imidazolonepropionase-like amidohydrolase
MATTILLQGCRVADARGSRPDPVDIVIRDGRIAQIGPSLAERGVAEGAAGDRLRKVDLAGATVVPGLVNMHAHLSFAHPGSLEQQAIDGENQFEQVLRMAGTAAKALRAGVTTMRLVGEPAGLDLAVRDVVRRGQIEGPRILTAGAPLTYRNGHGGAVGALAGESPEDYARLAQLQLDAGADLLKVVMCGGGAGGDLETVRMSEAEFAAIREVARSANRRIAVHTAAVAHPIMDMMLDDGVDTLEHCYRQSPEMLQRCIERHLLLVLTPLVTRSPEYFETIELPEKLREGIAAAGEAHWRAVCQAVSAGARVALGTDFLSHLRIGGTWAVVHELELYEEAGVTPARLLELSSRAGAEWLGYGDELGLVEEGYLADLLVLDADPMQAGAAAFRGLQMVIAEGRMFETREAEAPGTLPPAGIRRDSIRT